jgi:hypothetical protein
MRTIVLNNSTESNLMKLSDILRAHVEKLKRMDEELNREILESVQRCNNLLNELKQLDE